MSDAQLDVKLLPWQQEVFTSKARFRVVVAGRRTGKSREVAWELIISALDGKPGKVFYIAPTQGQAKEIMWDTLLELAAPVISKAHINDLKIKLVNGATISLKGADRPETMRGVSLKLVALDEYADMKASVFEQILRPALADNKGKAIFIGTPMGRNHFYDIYNYAISGEDKDWEVWHFTSFDNPLLDPEEIETARKSMSSFAFKQEFMASFAAQGSDIFKEEWIKYGDSPDIGDYYISIDLAGFADVALATTSRAKKLDNTAICVVKVNEDGWFVEDIIHGRWGVKETAEKIFNATVKYRPTTVAIEKGSLKNAVQPYIYDLMKSRQTFFTIGETTHGNQKKIDRIVWALQGRFENGQITLNKKNMDWGDEFLDELYQFPSKLTHDDLFDSLAYIDQIAKVAYFIDELEEDEWEPIDYEAGF